MCAECMDGKLRNLPRKRIQVDEARAFVYAKEKNVATAKAAPEDAGDVWGGDVDGDLRRREAHPLMARGRPERSHGARSWTIWPAGSSTTSSSSRTATVPTSKPSRVPSGAPSTTAMLIKRYGNHADGERSSKARYSPGHCTGVHVVHVSGRPDITKIIKPHRSLKNATPAMAAGLAEWRKKIEDIVALLDADYEATRPKTRGPDQKRTPA